MNYNPCFECQYYENCGKDASMRNYKFNRTLCHAFKSSSDPDIEIKSEMRERNFKERIEWLINNRIPRERW